jgi:RNA:NAD 2'-phosphotransferase (TPT1/KptA family)
MPGGRGRGGPMPRDVQVSKALSKLLRHSAEKEGLKLDEAGYINLKDVVSFFEGIYFPFLDPSLCSLIRSSCTSFSSWLSGI